MNDGSSSSVFYRMFNCVNEGIKWSTVQVKSSCPWRKGKSRSKSDIHGGEDSSAMKENERWKENERSKENERLKENERSKDSSRTDDPYRGSSQPPSSDGRDYTPPSQICPPREPPCCFIKKQDPCKPCCCETTQAPCPANSPFPDPPREPMCGCDLCKKGYPNDKCCDHRETFRRATTAPRYFERA
ncbi:hypothetical protein KPH14_002268 [Odynerus spinipes]|uniref:Uncharacterized protein n=1 Tax=Odynerus spinipes TaxID=1348599 RepID=A0AAD9VP37_9HYME|nr:hypothetical protein KPH14_002268 [Odynerus spinipes]